MLMAECWVLRREIRHAYPEYAAGVLAALGLGISGSLAGPGAEDFVALRSDRQIVTDEFACGLEWLVVEGKIDEALAIVGGAGQRYRCGFVVVAGVVGDHVHSARSWVYCHPLKELVCAAMNRIIVDPLGRAPGPAMIC